MHFPSNFEMGISLICWCFWWWTYQHHNELELEQKVWQVWIGSSLDGTGQISSRPFAASWGFPPRWCFFCVGNPCKKWRKFRLRNQSKFAQMERTLFYLKGLKFEPLKTTKNRPYSWDLAPLEGLGKHLAERSCQRLMNQIWGLNGIEKNYFKDFVFRKYGKSVVFEVRVSGWLMLVGDHSE